MTFLDNNTIRIPDSWEEKERLYKIIQRQKEQLEEIHSNIDNILWITKLYPFEIQYVNEACTKILGYTPAEMIQDHMLLQNSIHPDDYAIFLKCTNDTVANGKAYCEFRIRHKDGNYRLMKAQSVFRKGKNGDPDTLCGISTDITVLRETEKALNDRILQLTDIARFQSHQVRGPVATILGLAQLINTNDPNSISNKQLIDGFIEAAHELERAIKQMHIKASITCETAE